MGLFYKNGIRMSINRWIDPHTEYVLVILCQRAATHHIPIVARLAWVNIDDTDDASCPGFNGDAACLIELVSENILIVGQCDDELNDKFSGSSDHSPSGSPVCMLPADSVVLFMQANDIRCHFGGPVSFSKIEVEVLVLWGGQKGLFQLGSKPKQVGHLDDAQAITSKGKIVCTLSCTAVTEIKRLFTMVRWSGVRIWDRL